MPEIFGLTAHGFKAKEFPAIKEELEVSLRKEIDQTLHFGEGSVAGILTGIVANQARQVWEAAQGLYHSLQPQTATGTALDALCSLTGTYRQQATNSIALVAFTLDPNTNIPKDSRLKTIGGEVFITIQDVKNNEKAQQTIDAFCKAEQCGPILAHRGTEAIIMTPISGWREAVIKDMHQIGRHSELDAELRLRRLDEIKATGSSTHQAMRSRLLKIPNVQAVYIKEASRSFEVIVYGGADKEIAQAIWMSKPLGVESTGKVACTIIDSYKSERTIRFSRPEIIRLTAQVFLKVRRKLSEAEINLLKNNIADFAKTYFTLGAEIYASRFIAMLTNQPEVLDVTSLQFLSESGNHPPATIQPDQIAVLDFKDIHIKDTQEGAP